MKLKTIPVHQSQVVFDLQSNWLRKKVVKAGLIKYADKIRLTTDMGLTLSTVLDWKGHNNPTQGFSEKMHWLCTCKQDIRRTNSLSRLAKCWWLLMQVVVCWWLSWPLTSQWSDKLGVRLNSNLKYGVSCCHHHHISHFPQFAGWCSLHCTYSGLLSFQWVFPH